MKFLLLASALICAVSSLYSQIELPDSAKVVELGEVTITATRSPISADESPSSVLILDRDAISSANGLTLADLLSQSSSYFVRSRGGGASLSTLSIRGGASEHVLVLVDGMRYSGYQNGLADLSLLSLQSIDRVEVVGGGSSAFYGADALTGVVNVSTKTPGGKNHLRVLGGIGSYDNSRYALEGEGSVGKVSLNAGYGTERGRDDYSFPSPGDSGVSMTREGSDYLRSFWHVQGIGEIAEGTTFRLGGEGVKADRGSPGPYNSATVPDGRLTDDDFVVNAAISHTGTHTLDWNLSTLYHYNFETYNNPDSAYPINSQANNGLLSLNGQILWQVAQAQQIVAGNEYTYGKLEGSDFDSTFTRTQIAFYLSHTGNFDLPWDVFDRISTYTTIRVDAISDEGEAFTPKFGFNARVVREGNIRLRATIGKNFRSPSFNDLYFRYFSNPLLKPEHSLSFDASVSGEANAILRHTVGVGYFLINTKDRILFDNVLFIPVNIGEAHTRGVEVNYGASTIDGAFGIGVQYTYTSSKKINADSAGDPTVGKQIAYVPKDAFTISMRANAGKWSVNLNEAFIGERFTTVDNSSALPSYTLVNANLQFRTPLAELTVTAKAEVNNLLDQAYEVFEQYPMPGRNFRLTLGVEY